MRAGEITSLTWGQVDLAKRVITVGRAKTASGTGRQIPMNQELFEALSAHAAWFTKRFENTEPQHYLFPWGSPYPCDPMRACTNITSSWECLRAKAEIACRAHDLRHTALTKMAEAGAPESTMLAIAGHLSRRMLERYSHVRMAAKREAVEALTTAKRAPVSDGVPTKVPTIEAPAKLQ